jgi:hypothetical protein
VGLILGEFWRDYNVGYKKAVLRAFSIKGLVGVEILDKVEREEPIVQITRSYL